METTEDASVDLAGTGSEAESTGAEDPAGSWSAYALGAAGLIATALLWRLLTISQWSWFGDDWAYLTTSVTMPTWEYVFQNYNGHLMPLQFLLVTIMTSIAPLNFVAAILVSTALIAASLVTWAVLYRELFGSRKRLLIPFAILTLSPIFLSPSLWFAAGLQVFGLQLAMGLCLRMTLRVVRGSQKWTNHALLAVAYLGALLWWQKALLVTLPMVFVAVIVSDGAWLARLRSSALALGGPAVLTLLYIPAYLKLTSTRDTANTELFVGRTLGSSLSFYADAVLSTAVPSLLGGPWSSLGHIQAAFDTNRGAMTLLGLFIAVFATMLVVALRRDAVLILGMLGLYILVSWGLVLTSSRYDVVQNLAARDARYAADIVPVLCLALALAITPTREERGRRWLRRSDIDRFRPALPVIGAVALPALVLSMAVGNGLGWDAMSGSSPKAWVDNIRRSALDADGRTIYDSAAPHHVFLPGFNPTESKLSRMLLPLPGERTFNEPSENMLIDDGQGTLRTMSVQPATTSGPPTQEGCGFLVEPDATTRIDLTGELFAWEWAVELRHFTKAPGILAVTVGSERFDVPVREGLRRSQLIVNQAVEEIRVGAYAGSAPVCVTEVIVGNPVAEPAS